MLICFALQVIPAQSLAAETGIFFNHSTARKLLTDLTYYRSCADDAGKRLSLCNQDRNLQEKQIINLDAKVVGLQKDKSTYLAESEQFKSMYVKADQERVKAENDSPSRFRWFVAGFLTAMAAGVAAALAGR